MRQPKTESIQKGRENPVIRTNSRKPERCRFLKLTIIQKKLNYEARNERGTKGYFSYGRYCYRHCLITVHNHLPYF